MINTWTLFSVRSERQERAMRRTGRIAGAALALSSLVVLLGFLGVNLLVLRQAWRTTEWANFWSSSIPLAVFAVLPLALFAGGVRGVLRSATNSTPATDGVLREALVVSDQTIVPSVLLQPAPIQAHDLPSWPLRVGPLRRPASQASSRVVSVVTAAFMPFILLVCLLPTTLGDLNAFQPYVPAIIAVAVAPFVGLMIVLTLITIVSSRGKNGNTRYVMADEQGLRWEDGRSSQRAEMSIPWTQIRSLTRAPLVMSSASGGSSGTATAGQRMAYMIDGGDAVLQWTIGPAAPPDEFAASELLLRLAVTRTGKPLRDISALLAELAQAGKNATRVLESRVPALAANKALIASLATPARRQRRWGWELFVLVALLLLGALYGSGVWLQQYQPQYFAGLPPRVHAETPTAQSELRGNIALGWHGAGPDPLSGTYIATPAGYTLTGTAKEPLWSLYSGGSFANGAFEVTAAQSGALTKGGGDGAGIVLRSDANGIDFLTFTVRHDGTWGLWRFKYMPGKASNDWSYLTGGSSAAIHTGYGQANKLLVVARDKLFLFYVNDNFLGSYYARYDSLPSGGYAGVYLDDGSLTGTFTDFSDYPAPPLFALGGVQYDG